MDKLKLLAVYLAAKGMIEKLKSGKQMDQDMLNRLDLAVGQVEVATEYEN